MRQLEETITEVLRTFPWHDWGIEWPENEWLSDDLAEVMAERIRDDFRLEER